MEALSVGKGGCYILIAHKNQCWDTNLLEFLVHILTGDDASRGSCNTFAMIVNEPLLPLPPKLRAGGVVEKLLTEHDLHHLIADETQAYPTRNEVELLIFGSIFSWLRTSRSFQQHQRFEEFGASSSQ